MNVHDYVIILARLPITVPPLVPTLMSYRWYVFRIDRMDRECEYLSKACM